MNELAELSLDELDEIVGGTSSEQLLRPRRQIAARFEDYSEPIISPGV